MFIGDDVVNVVDMDFDEWCLNVVSEFDGEAIALVLIPTLNNVGYNAEYVANWLIEMGEKK